MIVLTDSVPSILLRFFLLLFLFFHHMFSQCEGHGEERYIQVVCACTKCIKYDHSESQWSFLTQTESLILREVFMVSGI